MTTCYEVILGRSLLIFAIYPVRKSQLFTSISGCWEANRRL